MSIIYDEAEQDKSTNNAPPFTQVSKNIANAPFARDRRFQPEWIKGSKTGRLYCYLDDFTTLIFPESAEGRQRCPTAFDVNVLLLILRSAHLNPTRTVEFTSRAAILSTLNMSVDSKNRQHLNDALELWSSMTIKHERWFFPKTRGIPQKRTHGKKVLPPPLVRVDDHSRHIKIVVSREWCEIGDKYFANVPLPLPTNAAAQNLILLLLAMRKPGDYNPLHRSVRKVCRKIGINHSTRNRTLNHALEATSVWCEKFGGSFGFSIEGDRLMMVFLLPAMGMDKRPKFEAEQARLLVDSMFFNIERNRENDRERV